MSEPGANQHTCEYCRGLFFCGDPSDLDWDGKSCSETIIGRKHPNKCGACGRDEWGAHHRERDEFINANGSGWRYRSSEFYVQAVMPKEEKPKNGG